MEAVEEALDERLKGGGEFFMIGLELINDNLVLWLLSQHNCPHISALAKTIFQFNDILVHHHKMDERAARNK